jgi:pyrimidine 5'-nucleotidase
MNLVFDLDNTIYHPSVGVLDGVDNNINRFMHEILGIESDIVNNLRVEYRKKYGVTLKGLILNYNVDPHHYLDFVHSIEYHKILKQDEKLINTLSYLPYKKYIFTNGSQNHAINVLKNLGVFDHFEMICSIEDTEFHPKPTDESFMKFLNFTKVDPHNAYFIDDMPENIIKAKNLGFKTIVISEKSCENADFCLQSIYDINKIVRISE